MNDAEVHSLILERLSEIEDSKVQGFLEDVLRHERQILDEPRGSYKEKYQNLVSEHIDADSIGEYRNE